MLGSPPPPLPPAIPAVGGGSPGPMGETPPKFQANFVFGREGTLQRGPQIFAPQCPPKIPPPNFFCKILFFLNFPAFLPHQTPPNINFPLNFPPQIWKFFQKLPPKKIFFTPKSFPTPFFYFSPKIPPQKKFPQFLFNFPAFLPHHTPPNINFPPKFPLKFFFLKFSQKLPPKNFFYPPQKFPHTFFLLSPKISPPQIPTISF